MSVWDPPKTDGERCTAPRFHYNARRYAEARATEAEQAFDRLGAIDTTDYDVTALATALLEQLAAADGPVES